MNNLEKQRNTCNNPDCRRHKSCLFRLILQITTVLGWCNCSSHTIQSWDSPDNPIWAVRFLSNKLEKGSGTPQTSLSHFSNLLLSQAGLVRTPLRIVRDEIWDLNSYYIYWTILSNAIFTFFILNDRTIFILTQTLFSRKPIRIGI